MKQIKPIYLVLLAFAAVYLLIAATTYHLILWDEAVYIGIGKFLFSGGKIGLFETMRPLGLPFILGSMWLVGLRQLLYFEAVPFIFSAGCIFLAYLVGKKFFGEHEGILASVLIASTPLFFSNSFQLMTEIPSTFFVLLSLYLFAEKRLFPSGMAAGIAVMFRFTSAIFLPAVFLAAFASKYTDFGNGKRTIAIFLTGFAMIFAGFALFNLMTYGNPVEPLTVASIQIFNTVWAPGDFLSNLFYYPSLIFWDNVLLLFSLSSLAYAAKNNNSRFVLILTFVYLAAFTLIPNKLPRFGLTFLPFIVILASAGMIRLSEYSLKMRRGYLIFPVLALLVLAGFSFSIHNDAFQFHSFPSEKPQIVGDYYEYFANASATVLSSDPVPAAYSDILIIPFYNNITDARKYYDRFIGKADYVIYSNNSFPCRNEECEMLKTQLWEKINRNEMVFNKTFEESKYIFRVVKNQS